jgi:hypothetical protein
MGEFHPGFLFSRRRHGDVVIPAQAGIQYQVSNSLIHQFTNHQFTNYQQKRGLYRIGIGPELMQYYDPIARHCERGEAERGNLKSTPTAAT